MLFETKKIIFADMVSHSSRRPILFPIVKLFVDALRRVISTHSFGICVYIGGSIVEMYAFIGLGNTNINDHYLYAPSTIFQRQFGNFRVS